MLSTTIATSIITQSHMSRQRRGYTVKTFLQTLFFFLLLTQISFSQGFWIKVGDMPEIRYAHTVNEINGKIYVVGGLNTEGGTAPTTALVYDRSSRVWDTIPLYDNKARGGHTSCVVGGKLYVIGGNDGNRTLATMVMFDPNIGWVSKDSMSIDRELLACVSIDGKIFVMGGLRKVGGVLDYGGVKTMEVYDVITETWSQLPDMPTKRWGHSAVVYDGKIYVVGGATFYPTTIYKTVEVYNPQDSTWTSQSGLMPTARYCLTSCLLNNKIYAIDGWFDSSDGPIYNKVEFYIPELDMWYTETPMPVARAALASIVLDGKIYVYGGTRTTHPNIGTSAIYELSCDDIFAQQPNIDKTYAKENIDSVLFRTRFSNPYSHQFTPHLNYANSDSTQLDSLNLLDDGLNGDSLANDGLYGVYLPPWQTEDFIILGVSTIDNQTNKYYNTPDRCRFTTAGPVKLDSIRFLKGITNYYNLRPFVRNEGTSLTISNAKIQLRCSDPWVSGIAGAISIPSIAPGVSVGASSWIATSYYDSIFPGYFNLKAEISVDGWTYWTDSLRVRVVTSIDDEVQQPLTFKLEQNYPNPFNPTTKISWQSPVSSWQTIKVYDILGNDVATLVNEYKPAGRYEVEFNPASGNRSASGGLASGIYFYQLKAGSFVETKKMILLR